MSTTTDTPQPVTEVESGPAAGAESSTETGNTETGSTETGSTETGSGAGPWTTVDEAEPPRRGARATLAQHPVATGGIAVLLAAGAAFGGGYWLGSAQASTGTQSTVGELVGDGTLGNLPGDVGPDAGFAPGDRPERPDMGGQLPGAPGDTGDGTTGGTGDGTTDGGVSDGGVSSGDV